jgi:predicted site-specific integrase-resolvase
MQQNGSTGRNNAVLYARVSSKDQEREGFSIPAQFELLRNDARERGMIILQEFVESESARESGRTGFGEMLLFLKKNRGKVRRIYRGNNQRCCGRGGLFSKLQSRDVRPESARTPGASA